MSDARALMIKIAKAVAVWSVTDVKSREAIAAIETLILEYHLSQTGAKK